MCYNLPARKNLLAGVMELADVPDSKSGGSDTVRVRPPPPAPERNDNFRQKIVVSFCSSLFSKIVVSGEKIREKKEEKR